MSQSIKFNTKEDYNRGIKELFSSTGNPNPSSFELVFDGVFIVEEQGAKKLKGAGVGFHEVKITPIAKLPLEKRRQLRRQYWGESFSV